MITSTGDAACCPGLATASEWPVQGAVSNMAMDATHCRPLHWHRDPPGPAEVNPLAVVLGLLCGCGNIRTQAYGAGALVSGLLHRSMVLAACLVVLPHQVSHHSHSCASEWMGTCAFQHEPLW